MEVLCALTQGRHVWSVSVPTRDAGGARLTSQGRPNRQEVLEMGQGVLMSDERKPENQYLKTPRRVFPVCPLDTRVIVSDIPAYSKIRPPLLNIIVEVPQVCSHLVTRRARIHIVSLSALMAGCPPGRQTSQKDQLNRNKLNARRERYAVGRDAWCK